MKTLEELKAFAEGYAVSFTLNVDMDTTEVDDWVVWDEYDINFVGAGYTSEELGALGMLAVVYPAGWKGELPDHLYSFVVDSFAKGETQ